MASIRPDKELTKEEHEHVLSTTSPLAEKSGSTIMSDEEFDAECVPVSRR